AVVAAHIVEPAGEIAAEHGQPHAARAAERADQRAGDDRAEIDREQAEAEQQAVLDLVCTLREVAEHRATPFALSYNQPPLAMPQKMSRSPGDTGEAAHASRSGRRVTSSKAGRGNSRTPAGRACGPPNPNHCRWRTWGRL